MKKIAIIAAMNKEINEIRKLLVNTQEKEKNGMVFITGNLGDKEIILIESGIGKVCAAVRCCDIISYFKPDYIINTGLAGGIDVKSEVCDVVIGDEVLVYGNAPIYSAFLAHVSIRGTKI